MDNIKLKQGSDIRILLVEDNLINQKVASKILEKYGYNTEIASNGKVAVENLKIKHYDLVLMDLQMPVMDGYEATQKIRNPGSNVLRNDIPIIAVTANSIKGDKEKCLSIGMNDYVSKPIKPEILIEAIKKHI